MSSSVKVETGRTRHWTQHQNHKSIYVSNLDSGYVIQALLSEYATDLRWVYKMLNELIIISNLDFFIKTALFCNVVLVSVRFF